MLSLPCYAVSWARESALGHCSLFAISLPPVNYIAVFSVDLQLRLTSEDIRFALVLERFLSKKWSVFILLLFS